MSSLGSLTGPLLDRRAFVAAGAAAGLAATALKAYGGAPEIRMSRFIAMRGAQDQRLVIGSVQGHYDGVVDGKLTPLFDVVGATFSRYRASDKGYIVENFEQAYYIDPETGAVLDHWKNPYTGQVVDIPVAATKPSRSLITGDLRFEPAEAPPASVHLRQFASQSADIGDNVVFVERIDVDADQGERGRPFFYHETTILRGRRADIDGSATRRPGSQTSYTAMVSWRPWLQMGDRPGHMLVVGFGAYGQAIGELPEPWLRATAKLRPDLLSDPEAPLRAAFP